jgi:hypothetical protein
MRASRRVFLLRRLSQLLHLPSSPDSSRMHSRPPSRSWWSKRNRDGLQPWSILHGQGALLLLSPHKRGEENRLRYLATARDAWLCFYLLISQRPKRLSRIPV